MGAGTKRSRGSWRRATSSSDPIPERHDGGIVVTRESDRWLAAARESLIAARDAVTGLESTLDATFLAAVERLAAIRGRIVVTGLGKSGLVAAKIAATLSSTGSPAVFLHTSD